MDVGLMNSIRFWTNISVWTWIHNVFLSPFIFPMFFHSLFPQFILCTFCLVTVTSLNCWYCHGKMVAEESWMTPASSCCEPDVTECNRSHCFFAEVRGSSSFWISGCTDDEFNGNQANNICNILNSLHCICSAETLYRNL